MKFGTHTLILGALLASLTLGAGAATSSGPKNGNPVPWVTLEPGLQLGTFLSPRKSIIGDSLVRVLRIDPAHFRFRLLNASSDRNKRRSAKEWVQDHNLVAAINASMYQTDNLTSVSLMKTIDHVNNTWYSKDRALLAFHPQETSLPPVQILDRDCQDVESLRERYQTLIQSIRMISCDGDNVWKQQDKIWSTSVIGMDADGHMLFVHVRSPYSTHDLIDILLELPIHLKRAMYVEGGPEAQLFIQSGTAQMEFLGSYSTDSNENDANRIAWPIPNVVGIERIPSPKTP
ncbi:phosphodiester glycosidase family protein [Nitrospina watsonii]|uniref:NAGPA domain-containing protein n=1 Tax=Nitrospina watsonii TaxID=1323948 RepID=A0ABN8VUR1_9BACT|nr:phosphodiester glycosidase family protein [Nitrospina watsonii]CAI2717423.1 NAGPA domain-containing protein [Nitrospina watsonii]